MSLNPATWRSAWRPGRRERSATGLADPSRGTRVALGFPLLAAAAAVLVLQRDGLAVHAPVAAVVVLLALPAAAERIVVQLGSRSWYTASTPMVVLAALLGGPIVGMAAGAATQIASTGAVWRRRLAEGGIAALQGLAAGSLGLVAWTTATEATAIVAGAMLAAVAINSAGRALVLLERRTAGFPTVWLRGVLVDALEAALMTPLFAVLLVAAGTSVGLVVTTMAALLAALAIAKRHRESTAAALASEQQMARRDQLTGAPNRRSFEESLETEHARIVRGGTPAGLFVVDVDRFKSINDRHGHRVGDEVLVEVVRRLTDGLRPSDVVARWGGEEITVLAPGMRGRDQVEQFGERIRGLVSTLPVTADAASVRVTVSVGGTLLDGSISPLATLHRADEALYDAKRTRDAWAVSLPPRVALSLGAAAP